MYEINVCTSVCQVRGKRGCCRDLKFRKKEPAKIKVSAGGTQGVRLVFDLFRPLCVLSRSAGFIQVLNALHVEPFVLFYKQV